MNYFAHAHALGDEPLVLAGAALPDWLSVADRASRVRPRLAAAALECGDATVETLARGAMRHLRDDAWFHCTAVFARLTWEFTRDLRAMTEPADDFRPSFLGHILVELLLDAALIARQPARLADYYRCLERLDATAVESAAQRLTTRPPRRLAEFIGLFCRERFLWDYLEDDKLLFRVNQVLRRVGLPSAPQELIGWLPEARRRVADSAHDLLTPPILDSEFPSFAIAQN